jgi:hypothetical protein
MELVTSIRRSNHFKRKKNQIFNKEDNINDDDYDDDYDDEAEVLVKDNEETNYKKHINPTGNKRPRSFSEPLRNTLPSLIPGYHESLSTGHILDYFSSFSSEVSPSFPSFEGNQFDAYPDSLSLSADPLSISSADPLSISIDSLDRTLTSSFPSAFSSSMPTNTSPQHTSIESFESNLEKKSPVDEHAIENDHIGIDFKPIPLFNIQITDNSPKNIITCNDLPPLIGVSNPIRRDNQSIEDLVNFCKVLDNYYPSA